MKLSFQAPKDRVGRPTQWQVGPWWVSPHVKESCPGVGYLQVTSVPSLWAHGSMWLHLLPLRRNTLVIQGWNLLGIVLGGSWVSGSGWDGLMGGSADPPLVEPKVHLLQVAWWCNSKHNGGANPIMLGSVDPTTMPIFCTMSPEAMILMIVKLVFHLAILGWLPNLHMLLSDAKNTCSECLQPNNDKYMWNQVICT
jgi:hypothetical protein